MSETTAFFSKSDVRGSDGKKDGGDERRSVIVVLYKNSKPKTVTKQPRTIVCEESNMFCNFLETTSDKPEKNHKRAARWNHEWVMFNWHHFEPHIMKYRLNAKDGLELHVGHDKKSIEHAKLLIKTMGYDVSTIHDVRSFFKTSMLVYFRGSPGLLNPAYVIPKKYKQRNVVYSNAFEWSRIMTCLVHRSCKDCVKNDDASAPIDDVYLAKETRLRALTRSIFLKKRSFSDHHQSEWRSYLESDVKLENNAIVKAYDVEKTERIDVPCCRCACDAPTVEHKDQSLGLSDIIFNAFFCASSSEEATTPLNASACVPRNVVATSETDDVIFKKKGLWHASNYEPLLRVSQNMIRGEECDASLSNKDRFFTRKQNKFVCEVPLNVFNIMLDCWQWHLFLSNGDTDAVGPTPSSNAYVVVNGTMIRNEGDGGGDGMKFCNVLNACFPDIDEACLRRFHAQFGHIHCYNASELGLLYAVAAKKKIFYRLFRTCVKWLHVTDDGCLRSPFDDDSKKRHEAYLPEEWYEKLCSTEHERIYLNQTCMLLVKLCCKALICNDESDVETQIEQLNALKRFVDDCDTLNASGKQPSSEDAVIWNKFKKTIAYTCKERKSTLWWLVGLRQSSWYEYSKHNVDNIERMLSWLASCRVRTIPPHLLHASLLAMDGSFVA